MPTEITVGLDYKPGSGYRAVKRQDMENARRTGYLDLTGRYLYSFPDEILELAPTLTTLVLSRNKLRSLPPQIGDFVLLKELYVDQNELTTFPGEFVKLTNLSVLVSNDNPFDAATELAVDHCKRPLKGAGVDPGNLFAWLRENKPVGAAPAAAAAPGPAAAAAAAAPAAAEPVAVTAPAPAVAPPAPHAAAEPAPVGRAGVGAVDIDSLTPMQLLTEVMNRKLDQSLTIAQLRALLSGLSASAAPAPAEQAGAAVVAEATPEATPEAAAPAAAAAPPAAVDVDNLTLGEVRELCVKHSLSTKGKKMDLVERLKGFLA